MSNGGTERMRGAVSPWCEASISGVSGAGSSLDNKRAIADFIRSCRGELARGRSPGEVLHGINRAGGIE